MMDQFRWYYNSTLTIVYNHHGYKNIPNKKKYSSYSVRDIVRKYRYSEEVHGNVTIKDFIYEEDRNETMIPEWWKGQVHARLPRGASNKFVSSLNSAISNYKNGNTRGFQMKYRTKKAPTEYLHFEDKQFPVFIRRIKSRYWFTDRDRKRKCISFSDIDSQDRGIEIIHDKITDKYFLHYPVERDWFPREDRRNDSQVKFIHSNERIISLDPGIRKFLVGYDPQGSVIFIGDKASRILSQSLLDIDNEEKRKDQVKKWKRIKNLVNELHWKVASFLVENYDIIILPEFRVSEMLRKKKLGRMTKRLMCMFSFHRFKEKLKFKCDTYNKKLILVDESYTSCTCGRCGSINNVKGKETFTCDQCKLEIDRDVSGARNIMIKNMTLR